MGTVPTHGREWSIYRAVGNRLLFAGFKELANSAIVSKNAEDDRG
jgi:hypothetical protein